MKSAVTMKRLQIMIEEDIDAQLARRAAAEGRSKASLIREFVRERVEPLPAPAADPVFRMVGVDDVEPMPVDDVVYR